MVRFAIEWERTQDSVRRRRTKIMKFKTTRKITFGTTTSAKLRINQQELPAGTLVYAAKKKDGSFDIRVCGTLLTQNVYAKSFQEI